MSDWRKVLKVAKSERGDEEERTYKISGSIDQLDLFELALSFMTYCNAVGCTRSIKINTDGDGAANLQVERVGGTLKTLPEDVVNREVEWSEGEVSYMDSELQIGIGT